MTKRYTHTNINAKDWKKLSAFYQKVFDCKPVPPRRDLYGKWIEDVTGIEGVHIEGVHLAVPGYEDGQGPTIEIFTYNLPQGERPLEINAYGFAHIAFEVDDVEETYAELLKEGGSAVGKMISRDYPGVGRLTLIYAKDPEGNIVEIQKWT